MLRYKEYITEKVLCDLLLESKLVYSKKFINLLKKMGDNKIAKELIKLYTTDVDIKHNFIDITDKKDSVSFIPDNKAQAILKDNPETWEVIDSGRYLTHSDRNDRVFNILGYDKQNRENWVPPTGTVGKILGETITQRGTTYVLFEEEGGDGRWAVLNKLALESTNPESNKVWTSSRNDIAIGRLVRAIVKSAGINFIDKDIEDFVNQYKSTFDFIGDGLKQFEIVSDYAIVEWYSHENYVSGGGSLNSSCMSEVNDDFFDIYSNNKKVRLVILYDDNGTFTGDIYKSNKIKGRALLWDATIDGESVTLMDRIYTVNDSDIELFKRLAEKNEWWYKYYQSAGENAVTDGNEVKHDPNISVKLDICLFDYYPYIDTIPYLDIAGKTLSNSRDDYDRRLQDTDGGYYSKNGGYVSGGDSYGDDDYDDEF